MDPLVKKQLSWRDLWAHPAGEEFALNQWVSNLEELVISDPTCFEEKFPELWACYMQPGGIHHETNVLRHSFLVFKGLNKSTYKQYYDIVGINNPSTGLIIRAAALFHDIGKPLVAKKVIKDGQASYSFHNHEVIGAQMAYNLCRYKVLLPELACKKISHLVRHHMWSFPFDVPDKTLRRWLNKVGPAYKDLIVLRIADIIGNPKNCGPVLTQKLTKLSHIKSKCENIIKTIVVFRDQLFITPTEITEIIHESFLDDIYSHLLGAVAVDSRRNNKDWLLNNVKLIAKNYNASDTNS